MELTDRQKSDIQQLQYLIDDIASGKLELMRSSREQDSPAIINFSFLFCIKSEIKVDNSKIKYCGVPPNSTCMRDTIKKMMDSLKTT